MKFSSRMLRMCLTLIVVLTLLIAAISFVASELKSKAASALSSQTYYVSKTGSNADGLSWATAWNELDQINWSVIRPGDTILLDGGSQQMVYTTTLTIGKSGVAGSPITIARATEAGRNGKVVIFGGRSNPLPYCGQQNYTYQTNGVTAHGIVFGANSWIGIDGMSWDGIALYGHNNDGVVFTSASSNDSVRNIEIYDNGDASQGGGGWTPNQKGVSLQGSNLTFEQVNVHDNGQDDFQSAGMNNVTIRYSWLHITREDPNNPGMPFNQCQHQDGVQIYSGGTQGGLDIEDSVLGPGLKEGVILGQAPQSNGNVATVNNVTFRNSLFLNKVNNIFGYPQVKESNWVIDHVTVWNLNTPQQGAYPSAISLEGSGHSVTNSVFYGGPFHLPDGLTVSSGNCQWKTSGNTSVIGGQTVDPQFMTDVSSFNDTTALTTIGNADFSLQANSPCAGKGSSITSVAQLISMATNSQPGPVPPTAVVLPTDTPVPTAVPTDTPVPTTVPTSTPILQPTSTPAPTPLPPAPFTFSVPLPPSNSNLVLYGDAGATGFVDRSFGYSSGNPCDTSMFVLPPCSYAISYTAYGGINFYHPNGAISTAPYAALQYDLNTNNQPVTDFSALFLNSNGRVIKQIRLSSADVIAQLPGGWVQISLPLSLLNPANVPITGIQLKNRTSRPLAPIHVDNVQLVGS